jgi:hypothetical protein
VVRLCRDEAEQRIKVIERVRGCQEKQGFLQGGVRIPEPLLHEFGNGARGRVMS